MKVNLLGAVSSLGYANFGLKRAVDDGEMEFGVACFYGQNIAISLNQCHVYIHPFYTEYIPIMYSKRCSMQRYASKICSIKLKEVR